MRLFDLRHTRTNLNLNIRTRTLGKAASCAIDQGSSNAVADGYFGTSKQSTIVSCEIYGTETVWHCLAPQWHLVIFSKFNLILRVQKQRIFFANYFKVVIPFIGTSRINQNSLKIALDCLFKIKSK